jgi:hypothetical protein
MSFLRVVLWLSLALYVARKMQRPLDAIGDFAWRVITNLIPGPNSKIRLAAQWMWWQLTKVERNAITVRTQSGGVDREAWSTSNPEVVIAEHAILRDTYTITHAPTGMAFFGEVPSMRLARILGEIIAQVGTWGGTTESVMVLHKSLPEKLRSWISTGNKCWWSGNIQ